MRSYLFPTSKLNGECYQRVKLPIRKTTASEQARSLGRVTKLRRAFALYGLGSDGIDLAALDRRRFDPRSDFIVRTIGRTGQVVTMQCTGPCHRTRHQHLLSAALMMEIAICEAHAGH